jgi:hypothetical protein
MTLVAIPAFKVPMVTTAACVGSTLRDTTLCSAITRLPAIRTGSIARCGRAA